MPVQIHHEPGNLLILRASGVLKRSEFASVQNTAARDIDAGKTPRVLAILESFEGWEKGADWNDLDYMISHGNEITKIAIVGPSRWEPEALAFAGAGFRRAPVQFFPSEQEAQARAWLAE